MFVFLYTHLWTTDCDGSLLVCRGSAMLLMLMLKFVPQFLWACLACNLNKMKTKEDAKSVGVAYSLLIDIWRYKILHSMSQTHRQATLKWPLAPPCTLLRCSLSGCPATCPNLSPVISGKMKIRLTSEPLSSGVGNSLDACHSGHADGFLWNPGDGAQPLFLYTIKSFICRWNNDLLF